jgi:hypothetical protein
MRKTVIAILLLIALVLIFFAKVIISNEYFSGLDLINAFYPWKSFLVQTVKSGELPLWNPYTFSGNPFIANFQAGIFYPLDIIFFITSIANAFRFTLILHIFLSGMFTYFLARYLQLNRTASIFSSCVFMFSGFLFVRLSAGHSTMINGYAWIPLIFYLFLKTISQRRMVDLILFSLALAIQFLCGHPQVPYYTLFSLFIYLIGYSVFQWKKEKKILPILGSYLFFIIVVVMALALAAIQILPAWQVAQLSATRAGGVQYELATAVSLSPKYLLLFFAPMLLGTTLDDTFWGGMEGFNETSGYLGIITLLLCIYGIYKTRRTQRTILFFSIGIISLIFAFGKHTPLYWLFYHYFPGFNLFRCPARWLIFTTFSTAILSGIGLHQLIEFVQEKKELKKYLMFLSIIGLIILLTIGALTVFKNAMIVNLYNNEIATLSKFYGPSMPKDRIAAMIPRDAMVNRFQIIVNTLLKGFGLFLISSSVFYIFWRSKAKSWYLRILPIVILLGDLWAFDVWFIPSEKMDKFMDSYYSNSAEVQFLKSDKTFYRILCLDEVLSWMHTDESGPTSEFRPNRLILNQLYDARGYDPVTLRSYVGYINRMLGNPPRSYQGGLLYIPSVEKCDWDMLSKLNVKYLITVNEVTHPNLELVFYDRLKIYRNKTALPRAYFVSGKDDGRRTQDEINFEQFNAPQVEITQYTPNRIGLTARSDSAGYLVVSELDYPGWHVTVDGKENKVVAMNDIFRSVYLEPGKHQVQFIYAPKEFRWGMFISLISLLACLIILLVKLITQIQQKRLQR